MFKKIVAFVCTLVLLITGVYAIDMATNNNALAASEKEQTTLSIDEARAVSMGFVNDNVFLDTGTKWTCETSINKEIVLYNVNNTVSAFSFELITSGIDSGYIIVSAYRDTPSLILEYSDVTEPLYKVLDNYTTEDKVIYAGTLNYYKEDTNHTYRDLYGNAVEKEDVYDTISCSRDSSNVRINNSMVDSVITAGETPTRNELRDPPITDPQDHANANYQGYFTNYEWRNDFENYCTFRTMDSYSGYSNHCGPTAITNLLELYDNYFGINGITSGVSHYDIFEWIVDYGSVYGYYGNSSGLFNAGGTPFATFAEYIRASFLHYGKVITCTKTNGLSYAGIKAQINAYRPFALGVRENNIYGNHYVIAYAYTKFVSRSTGAYKSYIKIEDGWSSSGRYLDVDTLGSSSYNYMYSIGY